MAVIKCFKVWNHPERAELQTKVACSGRYAGAVLEDIQRALSEANEESDNPVIVLEDLGLLDDSVMTLMKGLSRLVMRYPRTVSFWESSGYTEAFLSAMEQWPRKS